MIEDDNAAKTKDDDDDADWMWLIPLPNTFSHHCLVIVEQKQTCSNFQRCVYIKHLLINRTKERTNERTRESREEWRERGKKFRQDCSFLFFATPLIWLVSDNTFRKKEKGIHLFSFCSHWLIEFDDITLLLLSHLSIVIEYQHCFNRSFSLILVFADGCLTRWYSILPGINDQSCDTLENHCQLFEG